jgi:hypothetical protein
MDIYRSLGVEPIINAGGTFLEVEPEPDAIAAALREGEEEIVARQLRAQLHSA